MLNEGINPEIIYVDAELQECMYSNKLADGVHQVTHATSTLTLSELSPCYFWQSSGSLGLEGEGRTDGRT